jgi:3',5'-cyclic-AMP phosphodiesterase
MRAALLAQLSDPHVRVGPDDAGSARALAAAVDGVLALRTPPDAVIVTGDLAEHAAAAEYARVRELLAPLPMPVHVLPGNVDDADALREHFACESRYAVACGGLRLVACDTTVPGRDDGRLDEERLAWLRAQLAAEPDAPTIVAMHHPPLLTGIPAFDEIGLPAGDRDALAAVLAAAPQVRRVVAGHVHRAAVGALGGCVVVTAPSTNLQARLEIGARSLDFVDEPAGFALHVARGDDVVSHLQPVRR